LRSHMRLLGQPSSGEVDKARSSTSGPEILATVV
jgi:hypothetical protein